MTTKADRKQYKNKYDWPKIGNNRLTEYLDNSLASLSLAQTYIFAGPENLGKSTIALAFARNLLLSDGQDVDAFSSVNSDLHILEREAGKKNISIEAVRGFIKMLSLSSFLNSYKIGIIKESETLSAEAANALLKTLEEPREKVIIILLVSSVDALPATIVSRAQVLYFYPITSEEVYDYLISDLKLKRDDARDLAALSAGRPLLAAKFVENNDLYNKHLETARTFFNFFNTDISSRTKALNSLLANSETSLSADSAALILEIWQRAARDLLLASLDCQDLIQHAALKSDLDQVLLSRQKNSAYFLNVLELLGVLKKYLAANVSPLLVLEQLIYNL
jgi:DNA polymerase-3 subunit delta'